MGVSNPDIESTHIEEPNLGLMSQKLTAAPAESQFDKPAHYSPINEYAELKDLVKQKGLFAKQPTHYAYKILGALGLLGLSLTFLVVVDALWLQLLNAAFLAFAFGQIGLVGHDAGHQQIFEAPRKNKIAGIIISFLLASDRSWWIDKHNRHHSNPNDLDLDPDTDIPVLAFDEDQALSKRGLYRLVVRYQAFLFFPMLCLEGMGLRLAGVQHLLRGRAEHPAAVPLLIMAAHFIVYLGLLFYLLSAWHAALFIVVHQGLFGLYMGLVFAPNHKGMLILERGNRLDFLRRQVLTARNVKAHPLTDFLYGGLNYQIEHHLFPSISRNKLNETQKVVRAFCNSHSVSYYETSLLQSQREILGWLHQISSCLKRQRVH